MRVEKTTVAGESLTPMQIHYGVGEEAMLDCFKYEGINEDIARKTYFIEPKYKNEFISSLVSYKDTPCFSLEKIRQGGIVTPESFVSLVVTEIGDILIGEAKISVKKGEKWFVPYGCGGISVESGEVIVCYPPKI